MVLRQIIALHYFPQYFKWSLVKMTKHTFSGVYKWSHSFFVFSCSVKDTTQKGPPGGLWRAWVLQADRPCILITPYLLAVQIYNKVHMLSFKFNNCSSFFITAIIIPLSFHNSSIVSSPNLLIFSLVPHSAILLK